MKFKRGLDSRESLSIGKYRKTYKPVKKDWQNLESGTYILKSDNLYLKILWDLENIQHSFYKWHFSEIRAINYQKITHKDDKGYPVALKRHCEFKKPWNL